MGSQKLMFTLVLQSLETLKGPSCMVFAMLVLFQAMGVLNSGGTL
jgi:hypothetical protein